MTDEKIRELAEITKKEKYCKLYCEKHGLCSDLCPIVDIVDALHCEDTVYKMAFLDGFKAAMEFIHTKQAEDDRPFSIVWLQENFDWKKFYDEAYDYADITFEDVLVKDGNESGCINMHYRSSFYFSICKGLDGDEWLVSGDRYFRNDSWFPTIKTRGDFKRLFKVAIGIELPLKNQEEAQFILQLKTEKQQ